MTALKPCPFCGGPAAAGSNRRTQRSWVICALRCDVNPEARGNTPEEAAARWNHRPPAWVPCVESVACEDCGEEPPADARIPLYEHVPRSGPVYGKSWDDVSWFAAERDRIYHWHDGDEMTWVACE